MTEHYYGTLTVFLGVLFAFGLSINAYWTTQVYRELRRMRREQRERDRREQMEERKRERQRRLGK